MRPTWADVNLQAIENNVRTLRRAVEPAEMCAVVKADAYGHGAVPAGRAALAAGATWLGVALVQEGKELRQAGITAPILLLSEPRRTEMIEVAAYDLTPSVYSAEGLAAAAAAAVQSGITMDVHLKVDTGMGRVGCRPDDVPRMAEVIGEKPTLRLTGVWTHCPVADEPTSNDFTNKQLDLFDELVEKLAAAGYADLMVHAANSAGAIAHERARYDMVRCGISVYGIAPSPALEGMVELEPALTLHSEVSMIKRVEVGTTISYGRKWAADRATTIATVPIGYADGVRRRLWETGGQVLLNGKRYPLAGVITMDQLMFDCGDDPVEVGDQVVLIGCQEDDCISAAEVAERLGTIAYEVVCDIESRVPRRYQ